jgi:hypothetical protein
MHWQGGMLANRVERAVSQMWAAQRIFASMTIALV